MSKCSVVVSYIASLVCSLVPVCAVAQDFTDPIVSGEDEFAWHCASCHGVDGKGNGSLARLLIKPPADLTQIKDRNGGSFPSDRVTAIIAGREAVPGHDTFQMPQYWEQFKHYEGRRGYESAGKRIGTIVRYLETLQNP